MEHAAVSAADALKQARAAGIRVGIDGDHLALEASAPPPGEVLDLLARYKADILTLLRPGSDGWSGEDWRESFEERAGIVEFDGGLPRDQAEARAFSCCVDEWLDRNPMQSPPGRCDHCGQSKGMVLPYLTGYSGTDPEHTWLHQECSPAWQHARRAKAVSALVAMGLSIPVKFADDFGKNGST
jgi:hypothetical protein